jgi:dolichyl-phosphate-mannose--protein O-mannosyl transferase
MTLPTANGAVQAWRAQVARLQKAWADMPAPQRFVTVFLSVMVVGGAVLRVQGLAWPNWFTFDEEPFVKNAHSYALAIADNNDHPPFGKLLIAVGMLLFGYNSLGWRYVPLVFGLQTVCLAYWLGRVVFKDRRAGFMAAAFVAADGFFISYSRSGLLDGMMISFMLWGMVAALSARTWKGVLAAGALIGFSTSVKWSGVMTVIPAALGILLWRRVSIFAILWLGVVPIVHTLIWMGALRLTGKPSDVVSTWKVIVGLYKHHLDLGHYKNELTSPWYGWPILMHPVVIKLSTSGLKSRYSSSIGNLLLWFTTTLLVVVFPIATVVVAVRTRLERYWLSFLDARTTRGALLMLLGWFSFMAPWLATRSTRGNYTFSHYYLPCYSFLLVMLAGLCAHLERKHGKLIAGYIGVALLVSLFYAPVWGEFPMSVAAAHARLWFPNWRP